MTEEDFLARWSRRKREVAKTEAEPRPNTPPPVEQPAAKAPQKAEPEFDVASLPPIESINALTDVTAFLREGVPAELTRAALRRVWTSDPAIRDFVGLAENAWDFTDPAAMPGFGPLEATDDVKRMIAGIVEKIGEAVDTDPAQREQSLSNSKELSKDAEDEQPLVTAEMANADDGSSQNPTDDQVLLQGSKVDNALQHDAAESREASAKSSRPSHGGALPR